MQSTRWHIIGLLRHRGGSTVEELASALSLTATAVRQHLAILEKEALAVYKEVRRPMGRPSYVYSLTERGDELFPKAYDRMAKRILEEVKELEGEALARLSGEERLELLFQRMADRAAAQYTPRVQGETLGERVSKVTLVLSQEEGTLSEWKKTDRGYMIEDFNCPYAKMAAEQELICTWHISLLSQLLKAPVIMEQCQARGGNHCCYRVLEE